MKITDFQTNTEAWLAWRRKHVGASDQTHLHWASSWAKGAAWLWDIKTQRIPEQQMNPGMRRGVNLESEARLAYCLERDVEIYPAILESKEYTYLSASLDGVTDEGTNVVEIKCPNKDDHALAVAGRIPNKYIPQLCHQMFVAEADWIDYVSYDGQDLAIVKFERNEKLIYDIIGTACWFWQFIEKGIRPDYELPNPLFDTRTPVVLDPLLIDEAEQNMEFRRQIIDLNYRLDFSNQILLTECKLEKAKIGQLQIICKKNGQRYIKLLKDNDENEQL